MKKPMPEGNGLLGDSYEDDDTALNESLKRRREKLAMSRLHLQPDAEDLDPESL